MKFITKSNLKAKTIAFSMNFLTFVSILSMTVLADGDAIASINKLSDFIFNVLKAVGTVIAGWGVVQLGLSVQQHDPSARSQGILCLVGGIIVMFAKEIVSLIA